MFTEWVSKDWGKDCCGAVNSSLSISISFSSFNPPGFTQRPQTLHTVPTYFFQRHAIPQSLDSCSIVVPSPSTSGFSLYHNFESSYDKGRETSNVTESIDGLCQNIRDDDSRETCPEMTYFNECHYKGVRCSSMILLTFPKPNLFSLLLIWWIIGPDIYRIPSVYLVLYTITCTWGIMSPFLYSKKATGWE